MRVDAERMKQAINDYFHGAIDTYGSSVDTVDTCADLIGLVDMVCTAYPEGKDDGEDRESV